MIVINTVTSTRFSFNGVEYHKNFMPFITGNKVSIINVYDGCIILTSAPTIYSDFTVNGGTYASAAALQAALLDVIYTRATLSGGGSGGDFVPLLRTLTINDVTFDLTTNRSWTIPTHDAVTLGTPNGLSLSGQELSLGLASATNAGALSAADWSAFNAKQSAITLTTTGNSGASTLVGSTLNIPTYTLSGLGGIGGTLATGQVAFGTAANTVGGDNGLFWDNVNKRLGVGGTPGEFRLDVNGTARITSTLTTDVDAVVNGVSVGRGGGNISSNTRVGFQALQNNTTGNSNTANGREALRFNTTGFNNTSNGFQALFFNTTGSNNMAFGYEAGRRIADLTNLTITNNSVFLGALTKALADNQTNQTVIGYNAVGLGSNTTVLGNSSTTFGRWWGNLLIGDSVNSGQMLQVTGNMKLTGTLTNGTFTYTLPSATGTLALTSNITSAISGTTNYVPKFTSANVIGNSLIYDNGTNVGIGTASPTTKLQIEGTGVGAWLTINRTDSGSNIVDFTQSGSRLGYVGFNGNDLIINNSIASNTILYSNSLERIRITSGGEVFVNAGIVRSGSTANDYGSLTLSGGYNVTTANRSRIEIRGYEDGSATQNAIISYTNGGERMRITSAGNVLIGTTTDAGVKLNVNGAIKTSNPTGGTAQPFKVGSVGSTTDFYGGTVLQVEINGTNYNLMIADINPE